MSEFGSEEISHVDRIRVITFREDRDAGAEFGVGWSIASNAVNSLHCV